MIPDGVTGHRRGREQSVRYGGAAGRGNGRRGLGAALAVALLTGGLTGGLAAGPVTGAEAAVADPRASVAAPSVTEGWAPYLPQTSCDPVVKPGTLAVRSMLLAAYGGRDLGITRACDIGGLSEHKEGRAWDWGLDASKPAEKALATQFLDWLLAPGPSGMGGFQARRLGVMYVIYDGRIWSSYRAGEGWRPYSGGESHGDHLHISMAWNGAMKRTSWWTGKAAAVDYGPCVEVEGDQAAPWSRPRSTPCPEPASAMSLTGRPLLQRESTGAYVVQLQRLLSVEPVTGFFGPITEDAVRTLQKARGLEVTGTTTHPTWAAARSGAATPTTAPATSVTSSRALPSRMRYVVRPGDSLSRLARTWQSTVAGIRSASGLSGDLIRVGQTVVIPVRSGITKFQYTFLEKGDEGVVVRALQVALNMRPKYRTGFFGDITEQRVNRLKARHGWETDGIAGVGVWRALGA
jgi:peptidoglycan hydrolase-like protein with peptidoglycan-binding domain